MGKNKDKLEEVRKVVEWLDSLLLGELPLSHSTKLFTLRLRGLAIIHVAKAGHVSSNNVESYLQAAREVQPWRG